MVGQRGRLDRRVVMGRFVVVAVLIVAIVLLWSIARGVSRFARGISDVQSLPGGLETCGRDYHIAEGLRRWTASEASAGGAMALVVPGPFGFLTACPWPDASIVPTVLFVRVDEDAYVGYELRGGP